MESKNLQTQYDVFFRFTKENEVFLGSNVDYLTRYKDRKLWLNYETDSFAGSYFADNPKDAVAKAAVENGCNPYALYAVERTISTGWGTEEAELMDIVEATAVASPDEVGIIVTFKSPGDPVFSGKEKVSHTFVGLNRKSGEKVIREI